MRLRLPSTSTYRGLFNPYCAHRVKTHYRYSYEHRDDYLRLDKSVIFSCLRINLKPFPSAIVSRVIVNVNDDKILRYRVHGTLLLFFSLLLLFLRFSFGTFSFSVPVTRSLSPIELNRRFVRDRRYAQKRYTTFTRNDIGHFSRYFLARFSP